LGFETSVRREDLAQQDRALRQMNYFDPFHTYAEMLSAMQAVEAAHPDIAKLHDIGDSWEKTQALVDHDIWAMKISDNVTVEEPDEAEVLYLAAHHARDPDLSYALPG
jgi:hypothetical protein